MQRGASGTHSLVQVVGVPTIHTGFDLHPHGKGLQLMASTSLVKLCRAFLLLVFACATSFCVAGFCYDLCDRFLEHAAMLNVLCRALEKGNLMDVSKQHLCIDPPVMGAQR